MGKAHRHQPAPAPVAAAAPAAENQASMGGALPSYGSEVIEIGNLLMGKQAAPASVKAQDPDTDTDTDPDTETDPDTYPDTDTDTDTDPDTDTDTDTEPAEDAPLTLAELARTLDAKPGELMEQVVVDVDVPGEHGEKTTQQVTLGELRRGFIGAKKLEHERAAFEEQSEAKSLEFMQSRALMEELGNALGPHAPPEVIERVIRYHNSKLQREQALLLETIPAWKDTGTFTADRSAMALHLKPYGFTMADVMAISDHRIARYVRDQSRMASKAATAAAAAKQKAQGATLKKGQEPSRQRRAAPLRARLENIIQRGKASNEAGKVAAIGDLLSNIK